MLTVGEDCVARQWKCWASRKCYCVQVCRLPAYLSASDRGLALVPQLALQIYLRRLRSYLHPLRRYGLAGSATW